MCKKSVCTISSWMSFIRSSLQTSLHQHREYSSKWTTVVPSFGNKSSLATNWVCLGGITPLHKPRSHSRRPRAQSPPYLFARQFHAGQRRNRWVSTIGAEPGIDSNIDEPEPSLANSQWKSDSEIKIIDYSAERLVQHEVLSSALSQFLKDQAKPEWAACRWIYVNGLNWDVVKCLANNNTLHRLAIEDVLHASSPTKVDWYNDHAFIVMALQSLIRLRQQGHREETEDTAHPPERYLHGSGDAHHPGATEHSRTWPLAHRDHGVSAEQVSVFLTADNTVITIFERAGHEVLEPILTLLESPQTIVRSSNDPSMLLHAVIDTIVDLSLPIAKAFRHAFRELEQGVLMNATIAQSRKLYALRSELTRFENNIIPIGSVVGILRDHYAISPSQSQAPNQSSATPNSHPLSSQQNQLPTSARLISPLARTYLADVQDHVRVLANSTHTSIRSAENLTSLIFNTITAKQNESVRQLTLVSIFFLPLTFLTGYFGMNFDPMPIVNNNSDVVFWWIAGPLMGAVVMFMATRAAWARMSVSMRRRRAMRRKARMQ